MMSEFEIVNEKLIKCNARGEIIVPRGVKVIGSLAFNQYARKITLPEGVETIERYAFSSLYLGVIRLPKSVKEIKASAFSAFHKTTQIIYAGTAEDFMQINISKSGNSAFIKYMEVALGVQSSAPSVKTAKPKMSGEKSKKQLVAEYLENYAKENPVDLIDDSDKKLEPWNHVIVEHGGLFQFKEEKSILLVNGKTVSADCACRLGKMQMKIALNEYCKYVTFNYAVNPDKKVEAILEGKDLKWEKVYATSYKQIPLSTFEPLYREGMKGCVLVKNDIIDVAFEKGEGSAFAKIYMGDFPELPKEGKVQIPVRLRMVDGDIPTSENIASAFPHGNKRSFAGEVQEGSDEGCWFEFFVGEAKYEFFIEYYEHRGSTQVKEYKLGQDANGHYIDMLLEMHITKDYFY